MDAHTAANNNICYYHANALKLIVVNHKYAAQIVAHARTVERHAHKLVQLCTKIDVEAIAIAGHDYTDHHIVCFNEYGSIAQQQADNEDALQLTAPYFWMSLNWQTLWPIALAMSQRALYRLNCRLNKDKNKIEINPVSRCALGGGTEVKLY
jgi:hypothetical protein